MAKNIKTKIVTVNDLIEKLKTFDNLPVFVDGYEYGVDYLEIDSINESIVVINANGEYASMGGDHEIDDGSDYLYKDKEKVRGLIISR